MHSLMTVHAHPDDETISTGGIMSRYAREGHRVSCVTCTGGEYGEIVVPELDTPQNHADLAAIRALELDRALAQLGPIESHRLGYVDSGMMGTPENDAPGSFWQADLDEAAGRLVRLVRALRPQVLVSYNEYGGYGHPDHIRAALVTALAFDRAGDADWYPEQLGGGGLVPWQPLKRYEVVLDVQRRERMVERMRERGIRAWWAGTDDETEDQRQEREAQLERMAAARGPITTRIDVREHVAAKLAAMREHITQLAPDSWFLAFDAEELRELQPTEDFTLRASTVGVRLPEDDLFAGLPSED